MKPEIALEIVSKAVATISTDLRNHQVMQDALKVLKDFIDSNKED